MPRSQETIKWGAAIFLSLVFSYDVQALSGPQIAQVLNSRFQQTNADCVGGNPVYFCSGVLLHRTQNPAPVDFWKLSPTAITNGVEPFEYWRIDRAPVPAGGANGFVFADVFTAIGTGKQLGVQPAAVNAEALVTIWNDTLAASIPLQALFYDLATPGALRGAHRDQLAWFRATGEWMPVLRMQRDDAQQTLFGFNQADQLYVGYQVASRLNARYADTAPVCPDGRASYYCNGVLVRTTDQSTAFNSWNPSPGSVRGDGASFTYLRADAGIVRLYKAQGFVIREEAAPAGNPMTLRCAYPFDAGTGGSPDVCRVRGGLCSELGVTTVAAWVARYAASPNATCAFNTDPQQLQLSIEVRRNRTDFYGWNEFMVKAWPQNNPAGLPIEAFIYTLQHIIPGSGLAGTQYDQKDFFQVTGRHVPIIKVTVGAPTGRVFEFNPYEQGVQ